MKLLKFNQYISEAKELSPDQAAEARKFSETSKKLEYLMQVGLIDQSGYFNEIKTLTRSIYNFIKGLKLDPREEADIEIIKQIGSETGLSALNALNTQGALDLAAQGLHLVSSPTQLANGTLVWSMDPNYRRANGWGIGFFPETRGIRRMTPKQIDLGVRWGRPGSMDMFIKKWSHREHPTNLKFYDEAMQWAAENIDFEDVNRKPEEKAWKYYTKRTIKSRAPFNKEVHDLTMKAEDFASLAVRNRFSDPMKSMEYRLQAWDFKKQIGELEKDSAKISQADEVIDRIKHEIEQLKNRINEAKDQIVKVVKKKSKLVKQDFSNYVGDTGRVLDYEGHADKYVKVKMLTGIMKGSSMLFPTDIIETEQNNKVDK
jgi:hypothetical protein